MNRRSSTAGTRRFVFLLGLLLAGAVASCAIPFRGGDETRSTPNTPSASSPTAAATRTLPTATPGESAAPPGGAIAHFEPGQLVLITHIQMLTTSQGWGIGGLDGARDHVLRTQDGGTTWQDVTPPELAAQPDGPPQVATGVFLDDQVSRVLYHTVGVLPAPTAATVWATQNGGASWTASQSIQLDFLGTTGFPPLLRFVDADHGWLLAQQGPAGMHRYPVYLLRTGDGGATWETLIDPYQGAGLQSCNKSGVHFLDQQAGWVTVDDCPVNAPVLSVTSDGGRNWEDRPLPAPASRPALFDDALCEAHSPQLLTSSIGVVGVTCRQGLNIAYVYVTQDGGATWQPHLYPGGSLVMLSPQVGFALSRRIYQTLDGGVTWTATKVVDWDGQFSWVDERAGWAVARTSGGLALVKTSNAGRIWELLKPRIGP